MQHTSQVTPSGFTQSPDAYLQAAQQSSGLQKQTLLLQATAAYFYYADFSSGRQSLYQVNVKQLDDLNKTQYQLLNTRLALHDQQAKRALATISNLISSPGLSKKMKIEALQLQATAQQQLKLPADSIKTRIQLTPLLTDESRDNNQRNIWQLLVTLPTETLTNLQQNISNPILQGWAALALITRQYNNAPQQLLQQLRNWQTQFPSHPARNLVTTDINKFAPLMQTPQRVALLLPLQGPIAPQADAILNGFLSAYYRAKTLHFPVPTIKIYDTSTVSIVQQYHQAITDGANFVIGPLTKANVQLLKTNTRILVPTLALNYDTDNENVPNNLYEFALSPQNEALAVSKRATQLGYLNALTITPAGKWGENIAATFNQQWQAYNRQVIKTITFTPKEHLKSTIATLLNINQSYARRNALQKIIGKKVKFSARRRQDIDFIFLNAFPQSAQQIIPLLRFYYAGNIPVFATSQIYNGYPNPQRNRDLDSVQFPIMPWAINPSPQAATLRQQAQQLWPTNFRHASLLYAFGIDAYTLMTRMGQLQTFAKFGIVANTGTLFIDPEHRIYRQLEWAEFKSGKPILLVKNDNIISPLQAN